MKSIIAVLFPLLVVLDSPASAQNWGNILEKGLDILEKQVTPQEEQSNPPSSPSTVPPSQQPHQTQDPTVHQQAPVQPAPQSAQPAFPGNLNADKARVAEAQNLLNQLGYDVGPVDGLYGQKTHSGIRAFEADYGLPLRGDVTDSLIGSLAAAASEREAQQRTASGAATGGTGAAPRSDSPMVAGPLPGAGIAVPPDEASQAGLQTQPALRGDRAAEAASHGLHVVHGLPVIAGTRHSVLTEDQMAATSRYFEFVELGLNPGMIEADPACWARTHLPKTESERYLNSGTAALQSGSHFVAGGEVLGWKGADEFERERTKQAFLSDHAGGLRAKAVVLPLDVLIIEERALRPYDGAAGGFDLRFEDLNSHGANFDTFASYRNVATPLPLCAGDRFRFSPAAVTLPGIWAVDPVRAEQIVKRVNQRKVYIAYTMRFRAMPLAKAVGQSRLPDRTPVSSEITSIALYEDADLERPIETLDFGTAAEPVLLTGIPERAEFPASVTIDEETLTLLMLRDHGDVLDAEAWRLLMLHQAKKDQTYYSRKYDRDSGFGTYSVEFDDYNKGYTPFFPKDFNAHFQTQFAEAQTALFKKWAMLRAQHLPDEMILRATIDKRGSNPAALRLPVAEERDSSGIVDVLADRGYSVNQILRPDVNPVGVNARFNLAYLAGPGKSRRPAVVLPNIASHYAPAFSQTAVQKIFEGGSGSRLVEVLINTGPSELVPIDSKLEALVLQGAPVRLRAYNNDASAVLFEHQYQVAALDPKRLDVEGAAVAPPAVEALPLSAEAMDLLMVKHLPSAVSDEDYRQMLVARWEYEATIPPEKGEPDWGRFFVPGKPKPTEAQQSAMLARFKEWTGQRAAALPGRLRLYYGSPQIEDEKPISVFASGIYQLGEFDPNTASFVINSCTADVHSHPALEPACSYLKDIYSNTPAIYPFGLGHQMAGPRLRCRAALGFGSRESYCEARQAQFEKESSTQIKPGFREILVYDKEVFFPGTQSEAVSLQTSGIGMVVDIDVSGAHIADKPIPVPFIEALKKYEAFSESLGLGRAGWVRNAEVPSGTYFVFDAKVLSARLVDDKTQEPIAELELRAARKPDLEAFEVPTATATLPTGPAGPDIVGLRLGMTFEEAEAVIRSHMKVGRVLTRDRANSPEVVTGQFEKFSSSRIYVAEDNSEFIILYDEPPSTPERVVGITRQLNFAQGTVKPVAALEQLRGKYGREDWSGQHGAVGWGKGLTETTFNDTLTHECLPSTGNQGLRDWIEEDGSPAQWKPASGHVVPNLQMYSDAAGRTCGPVLSMQFDVMNHPSAADRMVLQLTDPTLYGKLYKESKRMIESGEATLGEGTSAVKLKL